MPELESIILSILEHHRGRENAIKGHALLYQINREIYPEHVGERKLREAIQERLPHICSCPNGYFLASSPIEAGKVVDYLRQYQKAFYRRERAILDQFRETKQGELFQ